MSRGARRLNRGQISTPLKTCIDESVRAGRFSLRSISMIVGFPDSQTFSKQLHREFATSTRTLTRWKRVAQCVGFTGELLERKDHE